ncbi:hypothetical protein Hdeb2414_s0184g00826571 [Helianthus debilis subsp. tardiflorus]
MELEMKSKEESPLLKTVPVFNKGSVPLGFLHSRWPRSIKRGMPYGSNMIIQAHTLFLLWLVICSGC